MKISQWAVVSQLFDEAMEQPEATRKQYVRSNAETSEIADQVLRLVYAAERETGFMATGDGAPMAAEKLPQGSILGNWKIEGILGTGGMGEVYLVERADGLFNQSAALKVIASRDPAAWDRFSRERQVLASLEHPGIGRLIDGGVAQDGRPFLVMEHVEGLPLTEYAQENNLGLKARLRLFMRVCDALGHAHSRLILHRDVKPNNVLVASDGAPRLIDFGVAALLTEVETDLRAPVTLRYAAPEQLTGAPVSVETDVFGLGMTLHELLVGDPPQRSAVNALTDTAALPRGLAAIIERALASDPAARYASAGALSNDIQNFLEDRPVTAVEGGAAYKFGLYLKRHWLTSASTAMVVGALAFGLAGTIWQAQEARRERDAALLERARLRAMQQATFVMFSEAGDGLAETNARSLVSKAAERVLAEFQDDPAEAAPVLHMFGELYYLMNDYSAAEPLLRTVADMGADEAPQDLVALASHDLSNVLTRSGNAAEARVYFDKAKAYWSSHPDSNEDQVLDGALTEAQLLANEGEFQKAADLLVETLPKRLAHSGDDSIDTAILYTNLGVARLRIGDLEGAIEASAKARDIFTALDRMDSPDGLNVANNLASLYHMTGRLDDAESAYSEVVDLREALYGASAAMAALKSNYAKLKLQKGDVEGALTLFAQAIPMADEYAGSASPPALAAKFGELEALVLAGELTVAEGKLSDLKTLVDENGLSESIFGGMWQFANAQVLDATGRRAAASDALDKADVLFANAGTSAARYTARAQALRESWN